MGEPVLLRLNDEFETETMVTLVMAIRDEFVKLKTPPAHSPHSSPVILLRPL